MPLLFTRDQIRRHLDELGFEDLTEDQLTVFIHDLKKLIKLEEKKRVERKRRGEPSPTISASTGTDRDRDTSYSYYSSPGQDEPDTRRTSDEDDYDDEESYQDENYQPTPEKKKTEGRTRATADIPVKIQKRKPVDPAGDNVQRKPLKPRQRPSSDPDLGSYSGSSSTSTIFGYEFGGPSDHDSDEDYNAGRSKVKNLPPMAIRRDPVALYHYYKSFWDRQKAPGENPRMRLRWNVRAGTLGRVPCDPDGAHTKYLR